MDDPCLWAQVNKVVAILIQFGSVRVTTLLPFGVDQLSRSRYTHMASALSIRPAACSTSPCLLPEIKILLIVTDTERNGGSSVVLRRPRQGS